ncbi:hypothetical protein MMC22_000152 [Lobaria immixta]|nr:hypothetical protein [Lobaria immixta]
MSPLVSSCGSSSTSPGSASSSVFSPHTTYPTNGSTAIGSFSSAAPVAYPPALNYTQTYMPIMYDGRPRNTSIPTSSGMPPPSQSPGNPNPVPVLHGATTREPYTTPTSHLSSYPYSHGTSYLSNSSQQSMLTTSRSPTINPMSSSTNSGYGLSNSSMQIDGAHYGVPAQTVPPFEKTQSLHPIVDTKGQTVQVELHAKIDKGFFKADSDWTCYRRNYFSVACSYTLKPPSGFTSEPLYLNRSNSATSEHIRALAICITARVSGDEGKAIDLVQHTPKRDKGPLGRPEKIKLMPMPPGSLGHYTEPAGLSPGSQLTSDYDSAYPTSSPNSQQNQTTANFERIQFKNATANNGKRRAAQQYFHIVVELFAEVSSSQSSEGQWIKVASRISARMVVRGRSPGHYSDDRRSSSTSMGPGGGSGGDSTGGPQEPNSSVPSGGSRSGLGGVPYGSSSRLGSSAYLSHHASLNHSPPGSRSSNSSSYDSAGGMRLERPEYPVLSAEDSSAIQEYDGYQYYPSPLYESTGSGCAGRPQLPPVRSSPFKSEIESHPSHHDSNFGHFSNSTGGRHANPDSSRSVKAENHDNSSTGLAGPPYAAANRHWTLNSASGNPSGGRGCGRFQGVDTSSGYYPTQPTV